MIRFYGLLIGPTTSAKDSPTTLEWLVGLVWPPSALIIQKGFTLLQTSDTLPCLHSGPKTKSANDPWVPVLFLFEQMG